MLSWGKYSGKALLRDLIFERPTARAACLEVVLECTVHADESIRAGRLLSISTRPTLDLLRLLHASIWGDY
jgi:hypothetical protein